MKKIIPIFLIATLLSNPVARADEGMWMLPFLEKLNIKTMHSLGCKLSAEDIYSINNSSLKDAVVIFGPGCTGEIISEQGLLLTNHHCGFDNIQNHSTIENDLLKNGFWAMSQAEELPNEGLEVKFLLEIRDVTLEIEEGIDEEDSRETVIANIETEAKVDEFHHARVYSFYGGNQYYLMIYKVYKDIRLVGAPPRAIGKFGADTDNWMWPRHTGDFALFRVYADENGEPADYSEDNVPLKPKHYFPISLKGVEKGDFTMIMGYPGGTQRYMSSHGILELRDIINQNRITIRSKVLEIWMEDMQADPEIEIMYATKYSQLSNYYKFSIGQNLGIKKLQILEQKKELEERFTSWVNETSEREQEYGKALYKIQNAIEGRKKYNHASHFTIEAFYYGTDVIKIGWKAANMIELIQTPEKIRATLEPMMEEWNPSTDKKVFAAMLELYHENVPENLLPVIFDDIKKKYNNDFARYADKLFEKSILTDKERFNDFLKKPKAKKLEKDPVVEAAYSIIMNYLVLDQNKEAFSDELNEGRKLFIKGQLEMDEDEVYYPDANFSMRLTYGKVKDYFPRDAVHYEYFTTMKGIMEKEDPDDWEFVVPEKLKELYLQKDYGEYGLADTMPVCFISDCDITGGNSGSPVINGNGEIVGLAFDGNWEAMTGDIIFNPGLQRCISVDIRYVLFIIDKFAGASHLVEEMTINR